jgi:hypothetical protein
LEEIWVEVSLGGFPSFGDFHRDGRDEARAAFWAGKDGGDTGAAADLFVEGLAKVECSQAFADGFREGEDIR